MKCNSTCCSYANEEKLICEKLDFLGINEMWRLLNVGKKRWLKNERKRNRNDI